jgi:hypothetical protein
MRNMRNIKFRAKVAPPEAWMFPPDDDNKAWDVFKGGEWVVGFLTGTGGDQCSFCTLDGYSCYVWTDTVGQFAGDLFDKNNKELCEGDIVLCHEKARYQRTLSAFNTEVIFKRGAFTLKRIPRGWNNTYLQILSVNVEIIGNITDNPELLKQEEIK